MFRLSRGLAAITLLVLFLLSVVLQLQLPSPAFAHTGLESSEPADTTTVEASVDVVTLVFTKPIEVFDDSVVLTSGATTLKPTPIRSDDGLTVTAELQQPLAEATWTVSWRVLAEDSHPREGTLSFTVAAASTAPTPVATSSEELAGAAESAPSPPASSSETQIIDNRSADEPAVAEVVETASWFRLERLSAFFRIVFYLGLMTAAGLSLFKAGPHSGQLSGAIHLARWTAVAGSVALVAGVLEVVIHVAVVSGDGIVGVATASVWGAVMDTGLGTALWLRVIGLGLLIWGGRRRSRTEQVSSPDARKLVGATLAIGSFQFVGHTASQAPALIVRSADAAHAVAAAIWIGGLVGLAVVTRHGSSRARARVVGRFSSWATAAVVGVAVAGLALAITNLPTIASTWQTWYGQLLMIKLGLVGILAALGAHNHFKVVPRIAANDASAIVDLRRTVTVEIVLAVVIVATTALLVNTSPI